jgi:UDP-N-acetylglucosamine acyltransferase
MAEIHQTAIIESGAEIGKDVTIGPYSVIEKGTVINDGCSIGSHVLIASGTTLGKNCKIHKGAVLGSVPQDLKFKDEKTFLQIGNSTTVREFATLNRGTTHSFYTKVGSNCLLMAYSHVAHDCMIGNNVNLANSVNLAGHVIIEDNVGIGGLTPVHQFVKIGKESFIGGGLRVPKDVPPFILAMGEPLKFAGLNKVGMQRRGYSEESLANLKKAYRILYRENKTVKEAITELENHTDTHVQHLVEFLKNSERGIIR